MRATGSICLLALASSTLASHIPRAASDAVACPAVDNDGNPLASSSPSTDLAGGISCQYEGVIGVCEYFSDGEFGSGSSACPSSASPATPTSPASPANSTIGNAPFPSSIVVTATAFNPNSTATPDATGDAPTCPSENNNGDALIKSSPSTDLVGGVSCQYEGASGVCEYFSDAGFGSGSSACPSSAITASSGSPTGPNTGLPSPTSPATPVTPPSSGSPTNTGLPSPTSPATPVTPPSSGSPITGLASPTSSAPPSSNDPSQTVISGVSCPPTDKKGSALKSAAAAADVNDGIVCVYETAGNCEYFNNTDFSSGSSNCPSAAISALSATSSSSIPASAPTGNRHVRRPFVA